MSRATAEHKATLEELARTHTETALNALVSVASKGESEQARVSAASALLDRGYGRPKQQHDVIVHNDLADEIAAARKRAGK